MADCIFCAICAGKAEASVVIDDDYLAFMDIAPFATGHTLIIPRRHVQRVAELTSDERAGLFEVGNRIGTALREAGLAEDVHFVLNDGDKASQTVYHVHLHVVPRRSKDLRRLLPRVLTAFAPPLWRRRRTQLDAVAERIRAKLDG
ncbi:MAG: HIT family protein [Proteobacteria bacterium]|nr:HIT family protein [Pseudomonadota bacterium]